MAKGGGISGLAVATAAVGGYLVYAGIRDVPLIQGLREIISGKQPVGREQRRTAVFGVATDGVSGTSVPPESGVSGTSVPGDPGNYTLGAVQPHVRLALNELGGRFGIKTIGGFRASDLDHGRGLAGDVMIDNIPNGTAVGHSLASYALANRDRLGITYIIYQMRIVSANSNPPWSWRAYTTIVRTGDWQHVKHVHLSFKAIHTYRAAPGPIRAV